MGTTSSLVVDADESENLESNGSNPNVISNGNPFETNGNPSSSSAVRTLSNHSLTNENVDDEPQEGTRAPLGITVKYLSEENARLQLANTELTHSIKRLYRELKNEKPQEDYDPDKIYGESVEQRLLRLEKHLASERQDKWSAIEKSEKCRVDLVNCQNELTKSNQMIEVLSSELEKSKARVRHLENRVNDSGEGESSGDARSSLSSFRADLRAKREARQRALAAISAEMNSLRDELQKERVEKRKLERELETRKLGISDVDLESVISDNNSLRNELDILTENAERLKGVASENIKLKFEAKRLNAEMDSLNLNLGELKFEYYEEKRKHERTARRLKELETTTEGSAKSKNDWEEEKEKFYEKYDQEKEEIAKRTNALKEVISITRQMLTIRESQVQELKTQLKDIEESVKRTRIMEENGLKAEYEKQLENIRNLKQLYEERVRLMETERVKLDETLQDKAKVIVEQETEIERLRNEVESCQRQIKLEREDGENMDREFRLTVARCKDLENELSLINNLFTQMLLGPFNSGNEIDLDKLTELLQENHDLIAEMTTREDSSEIASVLPKLLLDLITQVDGIKEDRPKDFKMTESCETISEQSESLLAENEGAVLPILSYKDATLFKPPPVPPIEPPLEEDKLAENKTSDNISPAVQEIASNLPKVWKVLMELLSHHSVPEEPARGDEKQCYKKVDTPNGPRTVISVSKTFIRLKDLILEKKALQKELTRLKQLNSHLETRLDDQEKRLSQVQCELHKTWGIVGRMRAQHQQLHNHEKILRYELQEKRVMLSELKQELEYCRDKWERARQKNDDTETEWKKLRREFAARKTKGNLSTLNDSGESGFSDEHESGEECDADRSSTQSPVDQKFLEEIGDSTDSKITPEHFVEEVGSLTVEENRELNSVKVESEGVEYKPETALISPGPSTSRSTQIDDVEKAREARDLRLKRLEEQCKLLVRQVDITSHKSNFLNNRLEELHEQYGTSMESRRSLADTASTSRTRQSERNEDSTISEQTNSTNLEQPDDNDSQNQP